VDIGAVVFDPVLAGQADVEDAVFEIARDLLGPDQQRVDLRIVDHGWYERASTRMSQPARLKRLKVAS
jgi:hypothetical protein